MSNNQILMSLQHYKRSIQKQNLPSTGSIMTSKYLFSETYELLLDHKYFITDLLLPFITQVSPGYNYDSFILNKLLQDQSNKSKLGNSIKGKLNSFITNITITNNITILLTSLWNSNVWSNIWKQFVLDAHRQTFKIGSKHLVFAKSSEVITFIEKYINNLSYATRIQLLDFDIKYSKETYYTQHYIDITAIQDSFSIYKNNNNNTNTIKLMKDNVTIGKDDPFGDDDDSSIIINKTYTPESIMIRLIVLLSQQSVLAIPLELFLAQYGNIGDITNIMSKTDGIEITRFMSYWSSIDHELTMDGADFDLIDSTEYNVPNIMVGGVQNNKRAMVIEVTENAMRSPILKIIKQFRVFAMKGDYTSITLFYINCSINFDLLLIDTEPVNIQWSVEKY